MFGKTYREEHAAILRELTETRRELAALAQMFSKSAQELAELRGRLSAANTGIAEMKEKLAALETTAKSTLAYSSWRPPNIRRRIYEEAGRDTAHYVLEHMNKVRAFNVVLDIIPYALEYAKMSGECLEFGVYSGKTINKIAETVPGKTVYGFDSFEGLPEDWRTGFEKGTFKTNSLPTVRENVELVQGLFEDTLPEFVKNHPEPCAFIHIDCDLYSSTRTVFQYLKDKIVSGTVILFDEYFNYPGWREGEYKAFQEFIEKSGLEYEYLAYVEVMQQVAVRIL